MKAHCEQGLRKIAAAALLMGVAPLHARAQPETPAGPVSTATSQNPANTAEDVVAVRIVTEDGRVLSEAPRGLPVSIGKPLDREQVAESIRTLYRTGDYADLRAMSTPVDGGVRVDFVVREQLFFNQVIIHGLVSPPTEASAIAAVQLALGEPFQADAVNEGLERLRELLREEGFYEAQVSAQTVPHPENHQMDVVINIEPGVRARIKEIQLKNGTEYRDAEILSRSKLRAGRGLTAAHVQRGTSRVRKFLVKTGHLNARAMIRRGTYDAKSNAIPLELEITEGPRVRIAVTGAKFSGGELKKLVPVYQEGAVDADLLEDGKRNIRERLERDGYFDAEVEYATSTNEVTLKNGRKGTEEVITYRVERGDRHTLLGIEITGNHYFDAELLRSRLTIYPKGFDQRARFSRRLLESDRDSMRNLYLANGFLEATVDAQALDNYKGKEGDLEVRFVIQEGKQTRVASLQIEGIHAFKEDELLGVVASTPGQPYSEFNEATDRDNILAMYFNDGFPEARFTATAEKVNGEVDKNGAGTGNGAQAAANSAQKTGAANKEDKAKDSGAFRGDFMRVEYRIEEGPQTRVRRILLAGYEHTRPGVIRREIRVKSDAPLRQGEVVESQRRLYNAPTLVSQFGAGWVRDARDNPADATKGNFNSADFSIADTRIGSSASFLRFYYQNSTYYPIKRRFSFARSIRIGILRPYGDTVSLTFPAQTTAPLPTVIPLPERFFAGGGTSLRGFALNQAGPRDSISGFPVGGQALLILNQEFRFPMRLPFIGTALSGALFYDGGNVYSRLSRVTWRPYSPKPIFNPASPTQCQFNCTNELNYFAHTVGLGFRYATPVGPIRIDLGYQLNRPQFVTPICPSGAVTVNCQQGQFGFQATRLPGFQIFFNLGSTF